MPETAPTPFAYVVTMTISVRLLQLYRFPQLALKQSLLPLVKARFASQLYIVMVH